MPYTIHAEIEFFVKKIDACSNNPEKPSTAKLDEHIICEYLMSPIWAFDNIENKPSSYHAEDCWKKFCTTLRERTSSIGKSGFCAKSAEWKNQNCLIY